jgi:hypothetical protein
MPLGIPHDALMADETVWRWFLGGLLGMFALRVPFAPPEELHSSPYEAPRQPQ